MAIVFSIFLVAASFVFFAVISYFLVRSTFPKIENDDWEERYIQMKRDTERFTQIRKRSLQHKALR